MDFYAVSYGVDIERHKDVQLLLAFNGADSYTKMQLIIFAF